MVAQDAVSIACLCLIVIMYAKQSTLDDHPPPFFAPHFPPRSRLFKTPFLLPVCLLL